MFFWEEGNTLSCPELFYCIILVVIADCIAFGGELPGRNNGSIREWAVLRKLNAEKRVSFNVIRSND
jgi:hypothetical protein